MFSLPNVGWSRGLKSYVHYVSTQCETHCINIIIRGVSQFSTLFFSGPRQGLGFASYFSSGDIKSKRVPKSVRGCMIRALSENSITRVESLLLDFIHGQVSSQTISQCPQQSKQNSTGRASSRTAPSSVPRATSSTVPPAVPPPASSDVPLQCDFEGERMPSSTPYHTFVR